MSASILSPPVVPAVVPGPSDIAPADIARSGIAWGPVLGGAVVATAVTVLLVALGSGFGFAAVSPVSGNNPSLTTFTVAAAIWLVVVQWISSFFGGYLAGRLRPGLGGFHRDEVTFRDTACGLVAWAVASLFVVGIVGSGAAALVGGVGRAATTVAGGMAQSSSAPNGYLLDTLFRPTTPNAQTTPADARAEAGRILATAATGNVSQPDHDYLAQLAASRTGMSPADAGKRVDDVIARETQAVNAARKATSSLALYTGFSMLIGAFIASVAGAIGGRQRDHY